MTVSSPVRIRVPASAANLGPGYDSFGVALAKYDEVTAQRTDGGLEIDVHGIGAGTLPTDETHLVVRAARRAFDALGEPLPGLSLTCVNRIPHGSGQGSSAAAIVAGILLARALTPGGAETLSDGDVFALATDMEGHPDNVAPVLFGGFTLAWMSGSGCRREGPRATGSATPRAVRLRADARIGALLFTADAECATSQARAVLPSTINHADAAANGARTALLVHAIAAEPALLFEATEDFLHQRYRSEVMPQTAELLRRLRGDGLAAVLSGAGPSVLVLGTDLPDPATVDAAGFHADEVNVSSSGAYVDGVVFASGPDRSRARARTLAPSRRGRHAAGTR